MKDNKKIISPQELINDVKNYSGKSGGWPQDFKYDVKNENITLSVNEEALNKKACRRLDPWGLAFLNEVKSKCNSKINQVNFEISGDIDKIKPYGRLTPDVEAFRRRVSFLNSNNQDLNFKITINGETLVLEDINILLNRPDNEIIRENIESIPQDNHPGRLEKDFQTWLYANATKRGEGTNTNERLAVLGEDFFKLKNKAMGIYREFPTGVFNGKISRNERILPTEFVDIVTLNKFGQLAVIELKLNDSQLEVIAQLLDYALFFRCYRDKLRPIIVQKLTYSPRSKEIICYLVNNHFHDRFDDVMQYYIPKDESYGFSIKKVVLGYSKP
jgi:hypothetical protein